jgi:sortase (surface protein transpeptidase)
MLLKAYKKYCNEVYIPCLDNSNIAVYEKLTHHVLYNTCGHVANNASAVYNTCNDHGLYGQSQRL